MSEERDGAQVEKTEITEPDSDGREWVQLDMKVRDITATTFTRSFSLIWNLTLLHLLREAHRLELYGLFEDIAN